MRNNLKYKVLTDMAPMRKSEVASDRINRFELVRSLLSTNMAQNTKPFPIIDTNEKVARNT